MSPCDSNKKNPCWKRSSEILLCLYSNLNPPMQSKIHLCQKISCGNQRPFSFYCCCPKWRYRYGHCWAQNYSPWPEVTYAVPEDLTHYKDSFNTFMLYLNVRLMMAPKDRTGTQGWLGRKSLLYFCQISLAEKQWRRMLCWFCAAHHCSQAFFISRAHCLSVNLLSWTGTKRYLYCLELERKVSFSEL